MRRRASLRTLLVGLAVVAGAALLVVALVDVDAYARLIAEDGPVEYASALLWLSAAAVTVTSLAMLRRRRVAIGKLAWLVYAAALVFLVVSGGEEISWGQRLIGFQPPDELLEINKQGESNIHNIGSISVFSNTFFLLTIVVFLVVPQVQRNHQRLRELVRRHDLPLVQPTATHVFLVVLAVWVLLGVRFGTLGFHPFSAWGHYTQMDDEIFELGAAYAFLALSCLDLSRRVVRSAAP